MYFIKTNNSYDHRLKEMIIKSKNPKLFPEINIPRTTARNRKKSSLDFWLSETMDIEGIAIPYYASNANAYCERLIGSIRREYLDLMIIFNERHLYKTLKEYSKWFNKARYHQGICKIPEPYSELKKEKPKIGKIVALPILNGLHHDYRLSV